METNFIDSYPLEDKINRRMVMQKPLNVNCSEEHVNPIHAQPKVSLKLL